MGVSRKLPPHGSVDVEFFDGSVVLTVDREDGISLSATLTVEELENLVEYFRNVLNALYKKTECDA